MGRAPGLLLTSRGGLLVVIKTLSPIRAFRERGNLLVHNRQNRLPQCRVVPQTGTMTHKQWEEYGQELLRLRTEAGMTQRQLGNKVGLSHTMIGSLERARRTPNSDYSVAFDEALETGGTLSRLLRDVINRRSVPEWFRDALLVEREAVEIREFESLVIPGMLQTEDHAHSLEMAQTRRPNHDLINKYVETRCSRLPSAIERGTIVTFVIPERVLRHPVGDSAIMCRQLAHIAEKAESGEVIVQVLTGAPCLTVGFPLRVIMLETQTIAYAEGADGGVLVDRPDRVERLVERFTRLQSEALPPGLSIELIRKLEIEYAAAAGNH